MECLYYCLHCFRDVEDWDELAATSCMLAVRCPYCQTVHTLYHDGTVWLNSGGLRPYADFVDE
jgi:DNA-directed RNA polymerase subunit RPC12/RpoP